MPNVTQATTISPPPDDVPPPLIEAQSPPDGFPHYESYLPAQNTVSMAAVWPKAKSQFHAFQRAVTTANGKLTESKARLPHAFSEWWVWNWADELLLRSRGFRPGLADIQAAYEFGRCVDGPLRLSDTSAVYPRDAEFTYYDRPLLAPNRKGGFSRPQHFPSFGTPPSGDTSFVPVPFPRSPIPHPMIVPQLSCEGFMEWAGFLASPGPLTPFQLEELSHVGCTEGGRNDWCLTNSRHHEERRLFTTELRKCFQAWVICVSDELGIAAVSLPEGSAFQNTLNAVLGWLERARKSSVERARAVLPGQNLPRAANGVGDDRPPLVSPSTAPGQPITVSVNYETFSPFTFPPCRFEDDFDQPEPVRALVVLSLGALVAEFRKLAHDYAVKTASIPGGFSGLHFVAGRDLGVDDFRRSLGANAWFDQLRTLLRTRFNAEPSAACVTQLIDHICQECGLTISKAEGLTIEEALLRLSPEPPAETVPPKWSADTRTLTYGSWSHRYGKRAESQEKVLTAFQDSDWFSRVTKGLPNNLGGIMRNMKNTLGTDCPIEFELDGTSSGVKWRVKASIAHVA